MVWVEGFAACVNKAPQGLHIDTAPVLLGPNTSGEGQGQAAASRSDAVTSKHRALGSNGAETEGFVLFEAFAELSLLSPTVQGPGTFPVHPGV